jgi:D-aminopeptidase
MTTQKVAAPLRTLKSLCTIALLLAASRVALAQTERPRIRDLGVSVGILPPGPLNAITDVAGVKVGQTTLIRGDNIRTGVTAILPHGGNL